MIGISRHIVVAETDGEARRIGAAARPRSHADVATSEFDTLLD